VPRAYDILGLVSFYEVQQTGHNHNTRNKIREYQERRHINTSKYNNRNQEDNVIKRTHANRGLQEVAATEQEEQCNQEAEYNTLFTVSYDEH
jgi:hypothetical protein